MADRNYLPFDHFMPSPMAEEGFEARAGKPLEPGTPVASLATIEDYLRSSKKIEVMHNVDDIILEPGEIDFFPRVFGDRAKIYPRGGHCGNMDYQDNVTHMVNVFRQ